MRSGDKGVARDGSHKGTYQPGADCVAKATVFGLWSLTGLLTEVESPDRLPLVGLVQFNSTCSGCAVAVRPVTLPGGVMSAQPAASVRPFGAQPQDAMATAFRSDEEDHHA